MSQVSSSFLERSRQGKPVNHYKVLGLEPTATEQDIRTAFKQMALKYHPDRATISSEKAVAEHIFKLVSEASRVLGEPSSRAEFDKLCL